MTRIIALIMAVLLGMSGCGYHLRGSTPGVWNLGRLYVQNATPLGNEVQRLLSLSGVAFADSAARADAILSFGREAQERRVLSVDPDTGKVREYELVIDALIRVTRPDGTVILEDEPVTLQRDYTFDETAALGKFEEEGALYNELRKDMAGVIVRRLQALSAHTSAAAAKSTGAQ